MRKLHNDGKLIDVDDRLPALQAVLEKTEGLVAAYLFGSYGTPYQTPLSDVDLAFLFEKDALPDWQKEMEFRGQVLDALEEEDVSITLLNRSDSLFQFEVLKTGRRLYCRDETALADFLEHVLRYHGDDVQIYERFAREYDAAFARQYGRG